MAGTKCKPYEGSRKGYAMGMGMKGMPMPDKMPMAMKGSKKGK